MVTYRALQMCVICERRPEDMTVVLDGKVVGLCDTCWQRGQDEVENAREGLGGDDDA